MKIACVLFFSCACVLSLVAFGSAAEPVDPLISSTIDSIVTARSSLTEGEIEFESRDWKRSQLTQITSGTLVWRGGDVWDRSNLYGKFEVDAIVPAKPGEGKSVAQSHPRFEFISTPAFSAVHRPGYDAGFSKKSLAGRLLPIHLEYLYPPTSWFSKLPIPGHTHDKQLTIEVPTTITTPADQPTWRVIDRLTTDGKYASRYVIDLARGGLVISSFFKPADGKSRWLDYSYDWAQDEHQVWYVKELKGTITANGDPTSIIARTETKVSHFSSRPTIPSNRFERASIQLEKGTQVVDNTGAMTRKHMHGGALPQVLDLDVLVPAARDGFANPSRGNP